MADKNNNELREFIDELLYYFNKEFKQSLSLYDFLKLAIGDEDSKIIENCYRKYNMTAYETLMTLKNSTCEMANLFSERGAFKLFENRNKRNGGDGDGGDWLSKIIKPKTPSPEFSF